MDGVNVAELFDGLLGGIIGTVGAFGAAALLVRQERHKTKEDREIDFFERQCDAAARALTTVYAAERSVLKILADGPEVGVLLMGLRLKAEITSVLMVLPTVEPVNPECFEALTLACSNLLDSMGVEESDAPGMASAANSFCSDLRHVGTVLGVVVNNLEHYWIERSGFDYTKFLPEKSADSSESLILLEGGSRGGDTVTLAEMTAAVYELYVLDGVYRINKETISRILTDGSAKAAFEPSVPEKETARADDRGPRRE